MAIDIVKAVHDKNIFLKYLAPDGELGSWQAWLSFLRVLYGLPTKPDERELIQQCTGRKKLPKAGFDECLLLCGRRSGKSKVIALVGAFEAVLASREHRTSQGEIPLVAVISPTRNQSRIIHEYMRGVFDCIPMLRREVIEEYRGGFKLRNGVEVSIMTGDPRTVRGFSVISAIVDEIAMFGLSDESKVRSDTELVRAIRPALATTGGRLLCVGTPYAAKGHAYVTYKRAFGNENCDILCWNAPSTTMNPTLNAKVVTRAIEEDPIAASVEYCVSPGLFREDVDNFISREQVESLVVPNRFELPPMDNTNYASFADVSGGRHDDACVAIAHREGRTVVLDCIARYAAPHNPYEVVASIAGTIRCYGLDNCNGDSYAAEWTRMAFRSHGIEYNRATRSVWNEGAAAKNKVAKPKSQLYLELLPRLHSGEIELLDNDTLISQLASLQRRTRSGGRDTVDHPPGGHDDVANCLAGVCDAVMQRRAIHVGPLFDNERTYGYRYHDPDDLYSHRRSLSQYIRQEKGGYPFGF